MALIGRSSSGPYVKNAHNANANLKTAQSITCTNHMHAKHASTTCNTSMQCIRIHNANQSEGNKNSKTLSACMLWATGSLRHTMLDFHLYTTTFHLCCVYTTQIHRPKGHKHHALPRMIETLSAKSFASQQTQQKVSCIADGGFSPSTSKVESTVSLWQPLPTCRRHRSSASSAPPGCGR